MVSKKYKYYLAFENSNCVDYITEKFWDSLKHKLLPIVMGARVEDYQAVAPPNSFLHVDSFAGPEELAEHLKYLDENPRDYNKHFQVSYALLKELLLSTISVGGQRKVNRHPISLSPLFSASSSQASTISL